MSERPVGSLTIRRQQTASDPFASAWVSAHAGSGKTHVLAQRVLRLLLAGARPSQVLCLTYTKAAAANMGSRVFEALARWATLDDAALAKEIAEMGATVESRIDLDFARRLFARAVETPGGLKIQTIHAFCEKLLHIFPLEANVPASFRVVDDLERAELMEAARRRALDAAMRDCGSLRKALELVARDTSAAGFKTLCEELLHHRQKIARLREQDDYEARVFAALGLTTDETLARIETSIIEKGEPPSEWPALARMLRSGSDNDCKLANSLESAFALAPHPDSIENYLSAFFTTEGEPRGAGKTKIITRGLAEREPQLLMRMESERDRLAPLVEKRKAAAAADRALAIHALGDAIMEEYERAKRRRGLLDYDDLIEGARRLLHRSNPSWVLYKLDAQIDHILLDEAQDTSSAQWDILAAIADEFCAGAGAREARGHHPPRSFFAVGDEKQSIFSFQGAAPERFDAMRRDFRRRFEVVERRFEEVRLTQSFRSAPGVLQAVDDIFAIEENRIGLCFDPQEPAPRHEAWKSDVAALIEIWEPIGAEKAQDPSDWRLPLDYADANDPNELLAQKLSRKVRALLAPENGECVEDRGELRPVAAGDILILVRKRGPLFEAIIRALKSEHVAVAGADRLNLAEHIAVHDLVALGRAALLPQDDLTLASVLKSPFFGFDDDDLVSIAPTRRASLFEALEQSEKARYRHAAERLRRSRRDATELAPFDFYSRVLGPDGGRAQLVARLGREAEDAIDEFLKLTASFEREQPPSLTMFLAMAESLDLSIKRDMESAGGAVRAMTAHAAKGLEAKIVFLPDTCGAPAGKHDPKLYALGEADDAILLWSLGKDSDPAALKEARDAHRRSEREESQRLLYVAMTRAEERLYICGAHGVNGRAKDCWYDAIRNALEASCETLPDPLESGRTILQRGAVPRCLDLPRNEPAPAAAELPAFATTKARREDAPAPPLRPSSALAGADIIDFEVDGGGAKRGEAERLLQGRFIHALLQHLPACAPDHRQEAARRFLQARGNLLDEDKQEALAQSALSVLADPRLAPLFGPESTPEVDVVATLDNGAVVSGRIDRIAETANEAFIAEFKTGRPRAKIEGAHLRQLALYRAAVAPLFPGKRLRCFLIFTQNASVLEADQSALIAALEQEFEQDARVAH
ncbi:double-strand break repair helicase AddA [Methylocystis sp. B8]|uniref:double-strand break repair helicase AddA n=1 Tax=Methylocystis sp. B8 TaxID=544938 RepID=UPI0010FE6BAA|nr:double-strand break repair helicase AddA [Methylocystis sp. B8]TLG72191.1 double-strand break repair helicase AddA [Methylocystis sp. B8]